MRSFARNQPLCRASLRVAARVGQACIAFLVREGDRIHLACVANPAYCEQCVPRDPGDGAAPGGSLGKVPRSGSVIPLILLKGTSKNLTPAASPLRFDPSGAWVFLVHTSLFLVGDFDPVSSLRNA